MAGCRAIWQREYAGEKDKVARFIFHYWKFIHCLFENLWRLRDRDCCHDCVKRSGVWLRMLSIARGTADHGMPE